MAEAPATRPSLIVRLGNAGDQEAWSEFVDLYAPLVYGYARKQGLQDADAADLTQDVLRAVSSAVGSRQYDPARGSFRGWLFTVVRNRLRNFRARERHRQAPGGTSAQQALEALPDEGPDAVWEREYQQQLFGWAAAQVSGDFAETTWRAFWQTAVEGRTAADVARDLGLSVGAVYIAKSRVLARLRERIREALGAES